MGLRFPYQIDKKKFDYGLKPVRAPPVKVHILKKIQGEKNKNIFFLLEKCVL